MNEKILFVDDDINILSSFKRQFRHKYNIETAESGSKGIEILQNEGPFAVVISDFRMPEMNGAEFLAHARKISPDTVRFMLTGQADMQAVIDIINKGHIFRFLTKPCPPDLLKNNIDDGLKQYRLVNSEKELLEKTLNGSVKLLAEILAMVKPLAFSRAARVRHLSLQIASICKMQNFWQMEIATLLSQLGCVTMPDDLLANIYSGITPSSRELENYYSRIKIGSELISKIPRLEGVSKIIYYQEKNYDGSGVPNDAIKGNKIPLGARILKVVFAFDKYTQSGDDELQALHKIKLLKNTFDPAIVTALEKIISLRRKYKKIDATIGDLNTKMIIAEDVKTGKGNIIATKGQEVSTSMIVLMKNIDLSDGIQKPIKVLSLSDDV